MQPTIDYLEKIIRVYGRRLEALSEETYNWRPSPEKWSKREILGHLIDSAQNNIRRFIVAQYEETPTILYNQDAWVNFTAYRDYPIPGLVSLWNGLNKHIVQIL